MKKKILVTGGNGFLGSSFIAKHKTEFDIVSPSSKDMNLLKYEDIDKQFKKHKFDAVLHLAASNENDAKAGIDTKNLIFFKNIQYAAIVNGVKKMIVAGDAADFNRATSIADVSEDFFGKTIPQDSYGLGRYLATMLAEKDKISTVLRFFCVYGPGNKKNSNFVSRMITDGASNKAKISLNGDKLVSAIYIDDAVKIIGKFLKGDYEKGCYNITPDYKTSVVAVAKKVKSLYKKSEKDITIDIVDKDRFLNEFTGSNAKLMQVMPEIKFTSMGSAVTKTFTAMSSPK